MRICRRVAKRLASVRPFAPGRDLIRGFCESKPDRLARLQKHRTYGAGMFENSETSPCAMVGGVIVAPRNPRVRHARSHGDVTGGFKRGHNLMSTTAPPAAALAAIAK